MQCYYYFIYFYIVMCIIIYNKKPGLRSMTIFYWFEQFDDVSALDHLHYCCITNKSLLEFFITIYYYLSDSNQYHSHFYFITVIWYITHYSHLCRHQSFLHFSFCFPYSFGCNLAISETGILPEGRISCSTVFGFERYLLKLSESWLEYGWRGCF